LPSSSILGDGGKRVLYYFSISVVGPTAMLQVSDRHP
jgi:hypothetical protein